MSREALLSHPSPLPASLLLWSGSHSLTPLRLWLKPWRAQLFSGASEGGWGRCEDAGGERGMAVAGASIDGLDFLEVL